MVDYKGFTIIKNIELDLHKNVKKKKNQASESASEASKLDFLATVRVYHTS